MANYILKKPKTKNKDWLVFKNSIFTDLEMLGCDDAIKGICYHDTSFQGCLDKCKESGDCQYGYYIETIRGEKSLCVPLNVNIDNDPNPYYKLRNKNMYPLLNNLSTKVFINKKTYKFPPNNANTVFYLDRMLLKNIESSLKLNTSPLSYPTDLAKFDTDGDLQVQLLPRKNPYNTQYLPVKYGEMFTINIPGTSLILRKSDSQFIWVDMKEVGEFLFSLEKFGSKQKIVKYSDKFVITHSSVDTVVVAKNGVLSTKYGSSDEGITFSFIPQMKGYYCQGNKCNEIDLDKMDKTGRYNGNILFRQPGCWGMCGNVKKIRYKREGRNNQGSISFIISIVTIMLVFLVMFFLLEYYFQ